MKLFLSIIRDANKRYRDGQRLELGWSRRHCLTTALAVARERRLIAKRQQYGAVSH